MVGVSTSFKTAGGNIINLSSEYTLIYREYFNKGPTARDFEHDLDSSVGIDWNPRLNTDIHALFVYNFKAGTDVGGDNSLVLETDAPRVTFKALDNLAFKVGLWNQFVNMIDSYTDYSGVNSQNPPGDFDDIRRGDMTADATGFDNYFDPNYYGTYYGTPSSNFTQPQSLWFDIVGVRLNTKYTPIAGTSVSMDYKYVFNTFSNIDNLMWTGHYIKPSISQNMPWKGGSVSLADELRVRKYDFAKAGEGIDAAKQNFRNRLTVEVTQAITSYLSWTGFYRWEILGANGDDYAKLTYNNWFYTGVDFTF